MASVKTGITKNPDKASAIYSLRKNSPSVLFNIYRPNASKIALSKNPENTAGGVFAMIVKNNFA